MPPAARRWDVTIASKGNRVYVDFDQLSKHLTMP